MLSCSLICSLYPILQWPVHVFIFFSPFLYQFIQLTYFQSFLYSTNHISTCSLKLILLFPFIFCSLLFYVDNGNHKFSYIMMILFHFTSKIHLIPEILGEMQAKKHRSDKNIAFVLRTWTNAVDSHSFFNKICSHTFCQANNCPFCWTVDASIWHSHVTWCHWCHVYDNTTFGSKHFWQEYLTCMEHAFNIDTKYFVPLLLCVLQNVPLINNASYIHQNINFCDFRCNFLQFFPICDV